MRILRNTKEKTATTAKTKEMRRKKINIFSSSMNYASKNPKIKLTSYGRIITLLQKKPKKKHKTHKILKLIIDFAI